MAATVRLDAEEFLRHASEDEYSYVLEGRLGALLGEDMVFAAAGDGPCRILEIISPGGFEHLFADMAAADPDAMTGDAAEAMDRQYGPEVDYESIPRLCAEHGLFFPEVSS